MVDCPMCGHEVNWVTLEQAGQLLGVSKTRVLQFIRSDRLPGSIKHQPHSGMIPFWKVPIESVQALHQFRRFEQGLINHV